MWQAYTVYMEEVFPTSSSTPARKSYLQDVKIATAELEKRLRKATVSGRLPNPEVPGAESLPEDCELPEAPGLCELAQVTRDSSSAWKKVLKDTAEVLLRQAIVLARTEGAMDMYAAVSQDIVDQGDRSRYRHRGAQFEVDDETREQDARRVRDLAQLLRQVVETSGPYVPGDHARP